MGLLCKPGRTSPTKRYKYKRRRALTCGRKYVVALSHSHSSYSAPGHEYAPPPPFIDSPAGPLIQLGPQQQPTEILTPVNEDTPSVPRFSRKARVIHTENEARNCKTDRRSSCMSMIIRPWNRSRFQFLQEEVQSSLVYEPPPSMSGSTGKSSSIQKQSSSTADSSKSAKLSIETTTVGNIQCDGLFIDKSVVPDMKVVSVDKEIEHVLGEAAVAKKLSLDLTAETASETSMTVATQVRPFPSFHERLHQDDDSSEDPFRIHAWLSMGADLLYTFPPTAVKTQQTSSLHKGSTNSSSKTGVDTSGMQTASSEALFIDQLVSSVEKRHKKQSQSVHGGKKTKQQSILKYPEAKARQFDYPSQLQQQRQKMKKQQQRSSTTRQVPRPKVFSFDFSFDDDEKKKTKIASEAKQSTSLAIQTDKKRRCKLSCLTPSSRADTAVCTNTTSKNGAGTDPPPQQVSMTPCSRAETTVCANTSSVRLSTAKLSKAKLLRGRASFPVQTNAKLTMKSPKERTYIPIRTAGFKMHWKSPRQLESSSTEEKPKIPPPRRSAIRTAAVARTRKRRPSPKNGRPHVPSDAKNSPSSVEHIQPLPSDLSSTTKKDSSDPSSSSTKLVKRTFSSLVSERFKEKRAGDSEHEPIDNSCKGEGDVPRLMTLSTLRHITSTAQTSDSSRQGSIPVLKEEKPHKNPTQKSAGRESKSIFADVRGVSRPSIKTKPIANLSRPRKSGYNPLQSTESTISKVENTELSEKMSKGVPSVQLAVRTTWMKNPVASQARASRGNARFIGSSSTKTSNRTEKQLKTGGGLFRTAKPSTMATKIAATKTKKDLLKKNLSHFDVFRGIEQRAKYTQMVDGNNEQRSPRTKPDPPSVGDPPPPPPQNARMSKIQAPVVFPGYIFPHKYLALNDTSNIYNGDARSKASSVASSLTDEPTVFTIMAAPGNLAAASEDQQQLQQHYLASF